MAYNDLTTVIGAVGTAVAASGVFLGIPAWRIASRSEHRAEALDEQREFNRKLARALIGSDDPPAPSPEHPSAVDVLGDIRELLKEHSELYMIMAWHLSDSHGPAIPTTLRRFK